MPGLLFWSFGIGLPLWIIIFYLADLFLWHNAEFHLLVFIPTLTYLTFYRYEFEECEVVKVDPKNNDAEKDSLPISLSENDPALLDYDPLILKEYFDYSQKELEKNSN
jgi:hypothetical protein